MKRTRHLFLIITLILHQLINISSSECVVTVKSETANSGEWSSLKELKGQTAPFKCRVVFQGYGNQRVSLKFSRFDLYTPENFNATKCSEIDRLTADVRVGSRLSRIDEWCGNSRPPQLMSSSNLLQLEYIKKSATWKTRRGDYAQFTIKYKFHTDWQMQHMKARVDNTKPCRFIFNSSLASSGKLWSINYPGLYPRNLHCDYIFHGSNDQIVQINFEYFDVEGHYQCDESTQSDFVLFSNYQTHDRTNRRFCGKVAPKTPILSESNYFRMIFYSNDIFDATGFYAHYQFITQQQEKPQLTRVKLTSFACSILTHSLLLEFLVIFIVF